MMCGDRNDSPKSNEYKCLPWKNRLEHTWNQSAGCLRVHTLRQMTTETATPCTGVGGAKATRKRND
ncbi:MAG TPA: hypothetical protein VE944_21110 [Nostoc sp.]|uniref:hypothetical protein n=1 Tax=Nostoc sp. TaxID=1180 RepID=UPI002D6B8CBA|nr:hypothetical protein [Nostoc sp.]HYX16800.1 hypothetical protein [Nostoc sp.]